MVDTDDIQQYGVKFENQLEKLRTADIDERDRKAILKLITEWDGTGSINQGTIVSYLNRLRLTSERAAVSLVEMDKDDVDTFIFSLKHDYELGAGTLRNYRKALRKFFKARDEPWATDITVGAAPDRSVDPNDLLTESELRDLLDATTNPRDKALLALLADTGLRIGAVCALRLRDLDLSDDIATVSINTEGNVKGAAGTVPLTWSEGYVGSWLNTHPRRNESDAALIHKVEHVADDDDGALTYQYAARRIKFIADDADVDRDRVNTHNFRKTAISRWIREGLSEQAIKHRACWDVDSDMIRTYSGVRDEELNDQILSHYGIETDDDATTAVLEACPRCQTTLAPGDDFCSGCGAALSDVAAHQKAAVTDSLTDDLVELDDHGKRAIASDALSGVDSDPELVREVANAVLRQLE
jgi:integrase